MGARGEGKGCAGPFIPRGGRKKGWFRYSSSREKGKKQGKQKKKGGDHDVVFLVEGRKKKERSMCAIPSIQYT